MSNHFSCLQLKLNRSILSRATFLPRFYVFLSGCVFKSLSLCVIFVNCGVVNFVNCGVTMKRKIELAMENPGIIAYEGIASSKNSQPILAFIFPICFACSYLLSQFVFASVVTSLVF